MTSKWDRKRVEFHGVIRYSEGVTVNYSYYEYVVVEETGEWVRFIAFDTDEVKELKVPLAYSLTERDCIDLAERYAAFLSIVKGKA